MQKPDSAVYGIFLSATDECKEFFFTNSKLGAMAFLCALLSNQFCLVLVLPESKVRLVL